MNEARCRFCGKSFRSSQAVRAHLRHCLAYRDRRGKAASLPGGLPIRSVPVGTTLPEADEPEAGVERVDQAPLAVQNTEPLPRNDDVTQFRGLLEAQERKRKQEAAQARAQKRRQIIQRVKDRVFGDPSSLRYTIPSETKARALTEVDLELSRHPVEELPEGELVTIAEGVRDRIYAPVTRAQDEAREEQQRSRERREGLVRAGITHANQILDRAAVQSWTRFSITQRIEQALTQTITGSEAGADVEALVDKILGRELEAINKTRRGAAKAELITDGIDYAKRMLDRELGLGAGERLRILIQVERDLEHELTGNQSPRAVRALVDELLDEELATFEDSEDEEFEDDDFDDEDDLVDDREGDNNTGDDDTSEEDQEG